MNEQNKLDIEKNQGHVQDVNMKEPDDNNSKHDEWTMESLKQELCSFNSEIDDKYRRASQMLDQRVHIADEIDAMGALLRKHNIKFVPQIPLVSKNGNNCWDDKSLFERNVVIRQSLRKSDDGATLKMVTYERNDLGKEQEKPITKKEAIEWLQSAGATDADIFEITGETMINEHSESQNVSETNAHSQSNNNPEPYIPQFIKDLFPDKQYCPNCDAKQPWGYRDFGDEDQDCIGRCCLVCGGGLPLPGIRAIKREGSAAAKDLSSDA